ncbi:AAA family ATPase [Azoarcus sp. KH32C]|uniref:AAA family ATPase n=1 Tax=Azoarcus sp. KH32C TaxID=748247 RepID=UPI0002385FE4|nr:AAA family ATPase [Azoarcus sp. KH32C]BAL24014.1 hypothetical protein AZKH_1699 [Azoarcus sp. KH32C]
MHNGHETERARHALWSLDAGIERAEWVRTGMAAKAAGLQFEDFDEWSSGAGNYAGKADCAAVWRSIKEDGGIKAGTLYAMAKAAGWRDEHVTQQQRPHQRRQSPAEASQQPEKGKRLPFDVQVAWKTAEAASEAHPYIERKKGSVTGLRVYRGPLCIAGQLVDGALMVPAYDMAGTLQTVQFIPPQGKKLNAPSLPMTGAFVVGRITSPGTGQRVAIVEGIGQAWSCNQAASMPAVVAFGASRMEQVARAFRERYPAARLVLVADAGKEQHCANVAKAIGGAVGWVEMPADSPQNFDCNDLHQRDGLDALAGLLRNPKMHPARFELLTPADLASLPPVRWRVRGVLPAEGIAALYGPSGSGKSFLTLDLLAAVASGRPWFGCRVKPAPVLYAALEGEAGIAQRIQAHQTKYGPLPAGFRFLLQPLDIRKEGDRADLATAAHAAGCVGGVLVIDTLNRAAPGADENDSASMGEIIGGAKALQAELGGLVLLVHHTGKDAARGLRGHSSLHAALDAAIEVSRNDDRREWRTSKSKDGNDDQGNPFRLEVVELGEDDDGEPVSSCVVMPEEPAGDAVRRVNLPSGGNQRIILDGLRELLRDSKRFGMAGAPPTRPCLELEEAIAKTRDRLAVEPDRKTERTRAAIVGLVNRRAVELREGWLWLP